MPKQRKRHKRRTGKGQNLFLYKNSEQEEEEEEEEEGYGDGEMNALVSEVIRACFSDAPREEEGERGEEKKQRWQVSRCDINKCTFCEHTERERERERESGGGGGGMTKQQYYLL